MIQNEIDELTHDINTLEEKAERLKRIRSYLRKFKKLQEIDIKYGLDRRRAAILHGENRREKSKR